ANSTVDSRAVLLTRRATVAESALVAAPAPPATVQWMLSARAIVTVWSLFCFSFGYSSTIFLICLSSSLSIVLSRQSSARRLKLYDRTPSARYTSLRPAHRTKVWVQSLLDLPTTKSRASLSPVQIFTATPLEST